MLKYNIVQGNNGRIIQVNAKDLQSWALHDTTDTPLKFTRIGGQAFAICTTDILVYHKPGGTQYGKAVMLHNGRALHIGSGLYRYSTMHRDVRPEFDRLARSMYEYEGTI